MSTINDGGPAFPATSWTEDGEFLGANNGMTLRDYFAAAALAGGLEQGVENDIASAIGPDHDSWWHPANKIARRAYAVADAMLKARKP
jgi:hypothetical protein